VTDSPLDFLVVQVSYPSVVLHTYISVVVVVVAVAAAVASV
jgi:hypothetical protein